MKFSVIMTVFDRPHQTLVNTLVSLAGNDWKNGEIVMVNDASKFDYAPIKEAFAELPIKWIDVDTCADNPDTYNIDGFNNPAYAMNAGLAAAEGEYIFPMSSDVRCVPGLITSAFALDLKNVAWMPCVIDLDTNQTYLGPDRLAPLGWFYGTHRDNLEGWDENYLKGIAFEDNDVMAQLALKVKRFVIDKSVVVWHQSHPAVAYSDNLKGWTINQEYTIDKWGGIPWMDGCPLKKSLTQVNHQMVLDVEKR